MNHESGEFLKTHYVILVIVISIAAFIAYYKSASEGLPSGQPTFQKAIVISVIIIAILGIASGNLRIDPIPSRFCRNIWKQTSPQPKLPYFRGVDTMILTVK